MKKGVLLTVSSGKEEGCCNIHQKTVTVRVKLPVPRKQHLICNYERKTISFFTENEKPKTQLTERDRLLFPSRATRHPNGSLSVPVTPVNKFQSGRQTQRGGGRNNVKLKYLVVR